MADKFNCRGCHKNIAATGQSPSPLRYRKHDRERGEECEMSRTIIPAWIVKRGPEQEDDDRPVIGRDYAKCPGCGRSPLLDGDGKFALHITNPGVPSAERVDCPMTGQPYAPEGEECTTAPSTPEPEASVDSAPAAPSIRVAKLATYRPMSDQEIEDKRDAAPLLDAEGLLSKWATKVREIENRELPETDQSPASTPTQPALPPRPDAPEAPPSSPSTPATNPTGAVSAAGAGAAASRETDPSAAAADSPTPASSASPVSDGPPPDVQALAKLFPRSARTPDGTAASAGPTPAAVLEAATREVQAGAQPVREAYAAYQEAMNAAPSSAQDAARSTAATLPTPADAPPSSSPFAQPGSPFSQPAKAPAAVTDPIPMTVLAEQVAARMKELFFSYDNRRSSDNRSAQTTLGPSEIGSPCDRRIAMSLMRVPPVNPGGDGWAAFVGTCIHAGLAEMFMWADAGTGRFAVEQRLTFPNEHVPKGTADLLDRTLCMVDDHKAQGRWSLDKLKTQGIPPGYRVQLHTYGYGQRLKGEVVDYVALISWPREASSLADLYVVVEAYDPQIARDALARVDRIAVRVEDLKNSLPLHAARAFQVADDCRYCPFHAAGDVSFERGCPGRE